MFVLIPLVIQIQGNQIRVGLAAPPFVNVWAQADEHGQSSVSPPNAANPGHSRLRRLLMQPSLN